MWKIFSFLVISLAISCGCYSEVKINISPDGWIKQNHISITIDTVYNIINWEYILDGNLNGEIDGESWIKTQSPLNSFTIENIGAGIWEIWIRGEIEDGVYTEPQMVKCYIDTFPPGEVKNISLKKIDDKILVFWENAEDKESGIQRYDGKIEGKIVKDVVSGKWEIKPKSSEFEISIWAVDKAGNEGKPVVFKKRKDVVLEKPDVKKKQQTKVTLGNIDVYGYRTYTIRYSSSPFVGTPGTTTEQAMNLSLSGNVGKNIRATGTIEDMPYQDRKIIIELKSPNSYIKFGDFNAGMSFGEFSSVPSKTITGIEAGWKLKDTEFKFLTSEAKSYPRTETRYGSNIKGPYQFAAFIVEGSETIRVNDPERGWYDRLLQRDADYEINYFSGEVMFKEVMWSTTKITITYEFGLPFVFRQGDLLAVQGSFFQKSNYRTGLLWLRETTPASGGIDKFYTKNEQHIVENDEILKRTKEYPLFNWPISERSEFITVNTQTNIKTNYEFDISEQKKGDYWVDYDRGTITFLEKNVGGIDDPPRQNDIVYVSYTSFLAFTKEKRFSVGNGDISFPSGATEVSLNIGDLNVTNKKRVRVWLEHNSANTLLTPKNTKYANRWGCYEIEGQVLKLDITAVEGIYGISTQDISSVVVEYKEIPTQDKKSDELKKEVFGITSDIKLKNITLQSEVALSQGDKVELGDVKEDLIEIIDIDTNNRTVVYSINGILQGTTNILGPYKLSSTYPIFENPHQPIEVRVNGIVIGSNMYSINYNDRQITFYREVNIYKGTKMEIKYSYLDPKNIGKITKANGSAFKTSISSNLLKNKISISTNLRFVSPDFDPIGIGKIPSEKRGVASNLVYKISRNINISSGFSSSNREGKIFIGRNISTSINYPNYPSIRITLQENLVKKDNTQESKNTSYNSETNYTVGKWTLGATNNQTTYKTTLSTTKNSNNAIRARVKPTKDIEFNSSFTTARNKNATSTAIFITTTNAVDVGGIFIIKKNYRISSKYNLQKVASNTAKTKVALIDVNFNVTPNVLKIKIPTRSDPAPITTLSGNYQVRKDLISTGGTDNTNYNLSVGFEPHKIMSCHSSFNRSKSKTQYGYVTTYDNFTFRSQIKPKTKVNLQISPSYSTSTNKSANTKTKSENYSLSLSFTPYKNLSVSTDTNLESRKEANSYTSTLRLTYPPSQKLSVSLSYLNRGTSPKTSTTKKTSQNEINTGLNYKMGKNVSGSFDIRYVDYSGERSYSGYNYTARVETRF